MKRKYTLGGFKLPINVVYDNVGSGGKARVQDSNGRTIKIFKNNFAQARKLAKDLTKDGISLLITKI